MTGRRAALLAAAVVALLVMVIGALEGAGVLWDDEPDPPPAPGPAWLTAIPQPFAMEEGLPSGGDAGPRGTSEALGTPWTLDLCGTTASSTDNTRVDFRGIVQPAPAARYVRQLGLYADAGAAQLVLDDFRRRLADCPTVTVPDGGPVGDATVRWTQRPVAAGEDALVAVSVHEGSTLASHYAVVRVGNAVYAQTYDGEFAGSGDDAAADGVDRRARPIARRVAARMCVFAASPC